MLALDAVISIKTLLIFLACMIIASIAAAIFIRPTEFQKSRINVFISILASVTVLLIGFGLIMSAFTLREQVLVNRAQITKQAIDKLWLYPNELLSRSSKARSNFLKSFYPNNLILHAVTKTDEHTPESILEEQYIAITMIQAWEDFLTFRNLDTTGDSIWMNNFVQWAQSPYLREYFDILKYNFKPATIELGNILFEYAAKLPIPTPDPEAYQIIVRAIMRDARTMSLLKSHS